MLCSLCFKQKTKCIQLPCNHIICYSCLPKQSFSQNVFRYQCETCLSCHQIDLTEQNKVEANNFKEYSLHSSKNSSTQNQSQGQGQCVFCWTCHQAITLRQYIKGRHHDHSVQTYEQALPSIKNLLLDQLHKTLRVKQHLQQNKQNLENNKLKQNYSNIVDKINEFFHAQVEILERKRQNILQQMQKYYSNSLKDIQKNIALLNPLIEDIQSLESKISHFLTDEIPITQINPISQLIVLVEEFTESSKNKIFSIPQLPQFIPKSTLKDSINQSCSLLLSTKTTQKKLNKVQNRNIKRKQGFGFFLSRLEIDNETKIEANNRNSQADNQNIQRKVKLVQKIKGKMKYSSSMCSTAFS